jgi:hypothetical protein
VVAGDESVRQGARDGVGIVYYGGRGIGGLGSGLEAADLLTFQQLQLAAKAVDGPEIAGDIYHNDGEERHDHNHG